MKVYGKCKKCKTEIGYSTSANTRVEFAMQDGENKTLNCKTCGIKTEFHVDELYTKESKNCSNWSRNDFFNRNTINVLFCKSNIFWKPKSLCDLCCWRISTRACYCLRNYKKARPNKSEFIQSK